MSKSLLDECHQSILKIAATQPPEGKKAILMMAETFRANAGRTSIAQPSPSNDFEVLIRSRCFVGLDRANPSGGRRVAPAWHRAKIDG